MSLSTARKGEISVQLTGVDKRGRGNVQASRLVQVSKVNNMHAVPQQEGMTIAPFHCSWQIKIVSNLVHLFICNFTM